MTSDEISQAFAHPESRAAGTVGAGALPDRISLRDHIVDVEIGAFQVERGSTQRLSFDIVVEVSSPDAPLGDDVDRILSYDRITEAIAYELAAERLNLLETLAERIAERILTEKQALRVFVRIQKLDRGPGALGVEIMRSHLGSASKETADGTAPLVIYLDPSDHDDPALAGFLTQVLASTPAVVCTCAATPAPSSSDPNAARRIALLAADQGAWQLAGREERFQVVASRTELDWAMKQGLLALWAPSKIVLDALGDAPLDVSDGPGLAAWLAELVNARALLVIGAKPPTGCNIEVLTGSIGSDALPKLP
ncbi:MAG: diguanylate cyclase [Rhodobacteraceae bacterium]|nr:diguanylate cyclase [Paracoccaceae bacterium]